MLKGRGMVNGKGTYEFLLYASKDPASGDRGKFRIKIWNESTGQVVYDNEANTGERVEPETVIKGGFIFIR